MSLLLLSGWIRPFLSRTGYNGLYEKLIDLIGTCNLTDEEVATIRGVHFAAWLSEYGYIFIGDDRDERYEIRDRESKLAYEQLMLFLSRTSQEIIDKTVADLADYLNSRVDSDITDEYARGLYSLSPRAFDDHEEVRYRLDLPLNDGEKERWESRRAESRKESPVLKTDPVAERIHQCINEYVSANNKKAYIEQIICDDSNAPFMRATLLAECMDTIFGGLHMSFTRRDYSKVDWTEQLEILRMEETFLWGMNGEELPDEQGQDWNYYVGCNVVNQIIVTAKLEMVDEFEDCVAYLLDAMSRGARRLLENDREGWRMLIIMRDYFNLDMNSAVNGLVNMGRACYAVPIVKRYIEEWLAYAHRQKNFDDNERRFIGVYKLLIECMEAASTEENIPEQYQMPYDEMIAEYKRRIEELTDTGYRIRNPEDE